MNGYGFKNRRAGDRVVKDARLAEYAHSSEHPHQPLAVLTPPGGVQNTVCVLVTGDAYGRDTTRPTIVSASSGGATTVCVVFSEGVTVASAQTAGNYSIDGGATVTGASLAGDLRTVTLTVSGLISGTRTLTVSNIDDLATPANTILPGSTATFAWSGSDPDVSCGTTYTSLFNTGYYPGEFCFFHTEAADPHTFADFGAEANSACLVIPFNRDEELVAGRYYMGIIVGERNGLAVVAVMSSGLEETGTGTGEDTGTGTQGDDGEGGRCSECEGCGWVARMHSDWWVKVSTVSGRGQFAGMDLSQVLYAQYNTNSTHELLLPCGITGGVVKFWQQYGQPQLSVGGNPLILDCCGDGTAYFRGGPATGFSNETAECAGAVGVCEADEFCLKVECSCPVLDLWDGEWWYCVETDSISGTGTGSADWSCIPLYLIDEDKCDHTIAICSGPYETEEAARSACPETSNLEGGETCETAPGITVDTIYTGYVEDLIPSVDNYWFFLAPDPLAIYRLTVLTEENGGFGMEASNAEFNCYPQAAGSTACDCPVPAVPGTQIAATVDAGDTMQWQGNACLEFYHGGLSPGWRRIIFIIQEVP